MERHRSARPSSGAVAARHADRPLRGAWSSAPPPPASSALRRLWSSRTGVPALVGGSQHVMMGEAGKEFCPADLERRSGPPLPIA